MYIQLLCILNKCLKQ